MPHCQVFIKPAVDTKAFSAIIEPQEPPGKAAKHLVFAFVLVKFGVLFCVFVMNFGIFLVNFAFVLICFDVWRFLWYTYGF